jgi:hypothetical protein
VKLELDLWYELWDRAGSYGLDTWYEAEEPKPALNREPGADEGTTPGTKPGETGGLPGRE